MTSTNTRCSWWAMYCAYVVAILYGLFYFGCMVLTAHTNTGDIIFKRMIRNVYKAAGGDA